LHSGFLGTPAPLRSDLAIFLEIAIGIGLGFGALFARSGRYRLHAWCQSLLVLLNLVLIGVVMMPSFDQQVLPRIPARLGKPVVAIATAHAAMGIAAECLAVYILLSAGTTWLPASLRLQRYRHWMRATLAVWWLALLLGLVTYGRWYVPSLFR